MIDPKELRIGNFLQLDGAIFRVTEITPNEFKAEPLPGQTVEYSWESTIQEIQITEEVLLKAGFKSKDPYCLEVDGVNIAIDLNGDLSLSNDEGSGILLSLKVRSFHHLQNIVFDLTGKELTL